MRTPCCLYVCAPIFPSINFWMAEPVFMKLRICGMAPESISTAHLINPSNHSFVSACVVSPYRR
jgi:hypothetical protein